MKNLFCVVFVCGLMLASLVGCGSDPDKPKSLAEQQSLMNGSHKPTKDQLAEAMSHIHMPGGAPTGGAAPRPDNQAAPQPKK